MNPATPPATPTPAGPPVPPGFWGVLRIIATRLPERQLLWLAVVVCGFMLLTIGLGAWQLHSLAQPAASPPPHPERVAPAELLSAGATRSGILELSNTEAHAARSCSCWQ